MDKLIKKISKNGNLEFVIVSFIVFCMTYGQGFGKFIYNHDSVNRIYATPEFGTFLESGRPLRDVLEIFPAIGTMSPQIMFILTFVMLLLNAYIIIKIFDVETLILKLLISITIITFPIVAIYWPYGNDVWIYSFGLVCASAAVYFAKVDNKKGILIFTILYLTNYQAILSYAVALYVLFELYSIAIYNFKLRNFVMNFTTMIFGAIMYLILVKFLLTISNVEMTTYLGADEVGIKSIITNIIPNIKYSYANFSTLLTGTHLYVNALKLIVIITLLFWVVMCIPILGLIKENKKVDVVFYVFLLVFFPIFLNAAGFATNINMQRIDFGILVIILGLLIFGLKVIENINLQKTVICISTLFAFLNIFVINEMFTIVIEKNTLDEQIANQIYIDLQHETEYTTNDVIAVCGSFQENQSVDFQRDISPHFGNSFIFRIEPTIFWNNLAPGEETEDYLEEIKAIFKHVGYNVNVVSSNCANYEQEYPKQKYIVKNDNVYEIYLSQIKK